MSCELRQSQIRACILTVYKIREHIEYLVISSYTSTTKTNELIKFIRTWKCENKRTDWDHPISVVHPNIGICQWWARFVNGEWHRFKKSLFHQSRKHNNKNSNSSKSVAIFRNIHTNWHYGRLFRHKLFYVWQCVYVSVWRFLAWIITCMGTKFQPKCLNGIQSIIVLCVCACLWCLNVDSVDETIDLYFGMIFFQLVLTDVNSLRLNEYANERAVQCSMFFYSTHPWF